MPQVQMPDGQVVELPDKMTPELQNRLKTVQSKLAAGKAQPKEPELPDQSPRTGMDNLGHQLGLGARYALEAGVSPVTGTMDAVSGFAKGASNIAGFGSGADYMAKKAGMPPTQPFKTASATDTFSKGLTAMGFPEPESKQEKTAQTIAEVAPVVAGGVMLAKTGISALSESAKAGKIKQLTDLFTGAGVKNAAAKAEAAVAKEAGKAVDATKKSGLQGMAEARQSERVAGEAAQERQRIEGMLAKPKPPTQSLGETGQILESSFKSTMGKASAARADAGNKNFAAAEKAAEAKEAAGQFVDTSAAFKHVDELLAHVKDVPELQKKVETMAKMLHGSKDPVTLVLDQHGAPLAVDKSGVDKTFKNLEVTRRYLNDIGYGAELEGFPGIARRAARDAVKELDKAMGNFTPEFRTYKDTWKKMSEPLESMGTRLGNALYGSEGGVDGKAYSKLADKDIAGKVFANKEQLSMFTDALAGGKGAAPAAQAEASKTVQKLALKYFEEQTSAMTPKAAKAFVDSPKQRDIMGALPNVKNVIGGRASGELSKVAKIESLAKQETAAKATAELQRNKAAKLMETRKDVQERMFRADTMAKQKSEYSQKKAVGMYRAILEKAKDGGGISNQTYESMINTLDQINKTEEQVTFMHKVASRAAWVVGGGIGVLGYQSGKQLIH